MTNVQLNSPAAVSGSTNTIGGYVFAHFSTDEFSIGHCKVDGSHQKKLRSITVPPSIELKVYTFQAYEPSNQGKAWVDCCSKLQRSP